MSISLYREGESKQHHPRTSVAELLGLFMPRYALSPDDKKEAEWCAELRHLVFGAYVGSVLVSSTQELCWGL